MSLADIRLSPRVCRKIRRQYKEKMRKWAPALIQSHAPPAAKGLMVILTDIWEGKGKSSKPERKPRRRRSKGQNGGYGVYDVRVLRRFGEWIKLIELGTVRGHSDN